MIVQRAADGNSGFLLNSKGNLSCWTSASPRFELASVLVRFDHVASFIVNANHSMM